MECIFRVVKLTIFLCFGINLIGADDFYLDRLELLNATYAPGLYNFSEFRIAKFNHTTYVINAVVDTIIDLGEELSIEVAFFYNRFNNNQYQRTVMRVPKMKVCDAIERYYPIFMTEEIKKTTNFPEVIAGKKYCPLKKVNSKAGFFFKNIYLII